MCLNLHRKQVPSVRDVARERGEQTPAEQPAASVLLHLNARAVAVHREQQIVVAGDTALFTAM